MYTLIRIWILINILLIDDTHGMFILKQEFIVTKNIKIGLNISERLITTSAIYCAAECSKRRGCVRVNFKKPECEIVVFEPSAESLVAQNDWKSVGK